MAIPLKICVALHFCEACVTGHSDWCILSKAKMMILLDLHHNFMPCHVIWSILLRRHCCQRQIFLRFQLSQRRHWLPVSLHYPSSCRQSGKICLGICRQFFSKLWYSFGCGRTFLRCTCFFSRFESVYRPRATHLQQGGFSAVSDHRCPCPGTPRKKLSPNGHISYNVSHDYTAYNMCPMAISLTMCVPWLHRLQYVSHGHPSYNMCSMTIPLAICVPWSNMS